MTTAPPTPPPTVPDGSGGDDRLHRHARYYRVPKRRSRLLGVGLWAVWLVLGITAGALYSGYTFVEKTVAKISPNTKQVRLARKVVDHPVPGKPENILLLGSDTRGRDKGDPGRSDSIILVHIDSQQRFISMLSFARDLWVDIPGVGQGRINSAYTSGEQSNGSGPAKVIETVRNLTGQRVTGYVEIDFKGFAKLVDKVGGVFIDVDRRYYHVNDGTAAGNWAPIDIEPGYQRLMGNDALDYVRFRHLDSDFSRVARQQMFLSELKRRTRGQLSNAPEFAQLLTGGNVATTDINDAGRLLNLVRRAIDTPDNRVYRAQVNGDQRMLNGQSVNLLNQSELQDAIQRWLNPPFLDTTPQVKVDPADVRVLVLNGSGRTLVGEDMAALLRTKRYRAVSGGNAASFGHVNSTVLFLGSKPSSIAAAQMLKNLLGPGTSMEQAPSSDLNGNDVAVVVGTDFTGQFPAPPAPAKPEVADVVDTTALVPIMRGLSRQTGMKLMAPLKVARGSSLKRMRLYRIKGAGSGKGPWAVKLVFQRYAAGGNQYWGVMATTMKNPPIMEGATGTLRKRGGLVKTLPFYNGKSLTREAFRFHGVNYWVSNAINPQSELNAETIHAIVRSFRPAATAKLGKGVTDVPMSVQFDAPTP